MHRHLPARGARSLPRTLRSRRWGVRQAAENDRKRQRSNVTPMNHRSKISIQKYKEKGRAQQCGRAIPRSACKRGNIRRFQCMQTDIWQASYRQPPLLDRCDLRWTGARQLILLKGGGGTETAAAVGRTAATASLGLAVRLAAGQDRAHSWRPVHHLQRRRRRHTSRR